VIAQVQLVRLHLGETRAFATDDPSAVAPHPVRIRSRAAAEDGGHQIHRLDRGAVDAGIGQKTLAPAGADDGGVAEADESTDSPAVSRRWTAHIRGHEELPALTVRLDVLRTDEQIGAVAKDRTGASIIATRDGGNGDHGEHGTENEAADKHGRPPCTRSIASARDV
jgi:hypothetical protein